MKAKTLEKDWQHTLVGALEIAGYSVQHVFPLQTRHGTWKTGTTASGWPDLVALRDEWLIAIEVKGEKTPVDPKQIAWLMRFTEAHCPAWILRPQDSWELISDWIAHPRDSPLCHGWTPLAPDHPAYPFKRLRSEI